MLGIHKSLIICVSIICYLLHVEYASAQSEFYEITQNSEKLTRLGGGQTLTSKWPISELGERIKTVSVDLKGFSETTADQFIEDMNSNPRITTLRIVTRNSNNYDPAIIKAIPLSKLKHVKHLMFAKILYNHIGIGEYINWDEIVEMPSLEFLYLQPFSGRYLSSGEELDIPTSVMKKLASKLTGYANYGYGGELDNLNERDLKIQYLSLSVFKSQTNKDLNVLRNCQDVKYLQLDVDTLSNESIHDIFSNQNLESIRIDNPKIDYVSNVVFQNNALKLNSLQSLECKSENIYTFQALAGQLNSLTINRANENVENIENFLNSCSQLEILEIRSSKDTLLPFRLNEDMPLRKFILKGSFVELPIELCSFDKLEEINIRYNKVKVMPSCISELVNLKDVNLSGNQLVEELPYWDWPHLKSLNLDNNNISEVSDDWCNNVNLQYLNLGNNPFGGSLESLSCCTKLVELKLSNTCIQSLPENINELQDLERLYVNRYKPLSHKKNEKKNCIEYLGGLPDKLSELENLNILLLTGQKNLRARDVQIVLESKSDHLEVGLANCRLDSLPPGNWQNLGISQLNLSGNDIDKYPKELFETTIPKLNLRGNELGVLGQNITNKTEKLIWQYSAGMDVSEEILKQEDVLDEVIELGNKFYHKPEDNPILDIIPIIIQLDTLYVLSKLNASNYGEALLNAERYVEAEKYLSMAIKKQKEGCFIYVNGIVELYTNRHKCYLEMKDTLSALNDLDSIQSKYGFFTGFQSFELNLEREDKKELERLKPIVIEKLKEVYDKEDIQFEALTELSILEIYLVTNDYIAFEEYNKSLTSQSFEAQELIYTYLHLLYKVATNNLKEDEISLFGLKAIADEFQNTSWSCNYVNHWARQFGQQQQKSIDELNEIICPSKN